MDSGIIPPLPGEEIKHCYCGTDEKNFQMLKCEGCFKYFHKECIKNQKFCSELVGDIYFHFTCAWCGVDGREQCKRMKLKWVHIVSLSLYNLQLQGGSKRGYFRWRENICAFIERHWSLLVGDRKKTQTWHGTVAGILSQFSPRVFKSGEAELSEKGWWCLTNPRPPSLEDVEADMHSDTKRRRARRKVELVNPDTLAEGLRKRTTKSSFVAAIEMKERRDTMQENRRQRRKNASSPVRSSTPRAVKPKKTVVSSWTSEQGVGVSPQEVKHSRPEVVDSDQSDSCSHWSTDSFQPSWLHEKDFRPGESVPLNLFHEDDEDESASDQDMVDIEDLPMDTVTSSFSADLPSVQELTACIKTEPIEVGAETEVEDYGSDVKPDVNDVDMSFMETEVLDGGEDSRETEREERGVSKGKIKVKKELKEELEESGTGKENNCVPLTDIDEQQLLKQLNDFQDSLLTNPEAMRLRRKLIIREKQRRANRPVFDLSTVIKKITGSRQEEQVKMEIYRGPRMMVESRILDKYMTKVLPSSDSHSKQELLITKLMGGGTEEIKFRSPYTDRDLPTTIWEDFDTVPNRVKLMEEIVSYHHRNDPSWRPGEHSPIRYCYMRPQHVPAINSLCCQFFWPNIDLCDCLQFPDFTCVALYKKLIIGFAVMVLDEEHNVGYILYIFTHPDWSNSGIGTFMLYHIVQSCMGKDLTLHCSATNPALFLYQKFRFKTEEYIVNFYDRYYREGSTECKHAVFLRLAR